MKILLYGFRPYKKWKDNVSENILNSIKTNETVKKIVFPANFNSRLFINSIKKHNPDIIIGMGQYSRGRKIRIERKAINIKKLKKSNQEKSIFKNTPAHYFVNLKLKKKDNNWISYDAGYYLCNFSMYVIMNYINSKSPKTRFAFVHIPRRCSLKEAEEYLQFLIKDLKSQLSLISFRRRL